MKPSELSLFSAKEQTLLVATERARLAELSEDELGDLLSLVRRARNKYTGLHRRQAAASVTSARKRSASATSNVRTLRKAEIFEDALARVSRQLSVAARATANELKRERLEAARGEVAAPRPASPRSRTASANAADRLARHPAPGPVTERRVASTRATNARRQAKRDAR